MKLLRISSLIYFLLFSLILIIAGKLILNLVFDIYKNETYEKLIINKERIVKLIQDNQQVSEIKPIIEFEQITAIKPDTSFTSIKWIFDPLEEEKEQFMEIVTFKKINGKQYKIIVRQVFMETHDFSDSIINALIISFSSLLFILILLNYLISKLIWKSFYNNLEILQSLSLEKGDTLKLNSSRIKEFQTLNQVIQSLYQRISHDYKVVKEFSEYASHEIQTPLAVIQAKQEHILQDPNLSFENSQIILSTLESISRLSRLNKGLLLITKIENRQFNDIRQINLNTFIQTVISEFEELLKQHKIEVKTQFLNELTIVADLVLVEILFSNLLSNAIKHNIENGYISIHIADKELKIENSGIKLNKNPTTLFQRFAKGNDSTSSIGLGLAIVEKIVKMYDWKISYESKENTHILKIKF